MVRHHIVFRRNLCLGCQACEIACKQEHDIPVGPRWIRVFTIGPARKSGKLNLYFRLVRCLHCSKPLCIDSCPTKAIGKRLDGIVLIDDKLCIGCGVCIEACPFGAPQFNPEKDTIEKCNLCVHRIDEGLSPACVLVCPTKALIFGDESKINEDMRVKK